jgi:hypothetical protein
VLGHLGHRDLLAAFDGDVELDGVVDLGQGVGGN